MQATDYNKTEDTSLDVGRVTVHHEDCPLCGGQKIETVCESPKIARCLNCQHAFRQEISGDVFHSYTGNVKMPSFFEARMFAKHHYGFIERNVGFKNISNILEIGSGDGILLELIRKKHPEIELYSVEPSQYLCQRLRKIPGLKVINAYIENASLNRQFDLVVMSHVLEHLERPIEILRFIYNNLINSTGYLYIDIPSQDFELKSERMAAMAPSDHSFFFDGQNIQFILALAGFSKNRIDGAKYATIPSRYSSRIEKMFDLKNSRRLSDVIKLYNIKILNRASMFFAAFARAITDARPEEISLDKIDSLFNNMAIIACK